MLDILANIAYALAGYTANSASFAFAAQPKEPANVSKLFR